jgi:hypothetical protein
MLNNILKNVKLILGLIAVILLLAVIFMGIRNSSLKKDNERLISDQYALVKDLNYYKTESGKEAARSREIELKKNEFELLCADQVKIIEDMGIKIKRLESISSTGTSTNTGGTTELKDSTIREKHDTLYIDKTVKSFSWFDNWNTITGIIDSNKVECFYSGRDTLYIATHRVPKKFLFFRFGTKYIEATVTNSNPSTKITYNKTVKIIK